MPQNFIDIIIIVVLLYGAYRGFVSGLIVEVSTLFALILGIFLSLKFADMTELYLAKVISVPESYSYYIAFGITFLVVVIIINILGQVLTRFVDMISLGIFNKIFGTLLGVVKAMAIVCVILFIVNAIDVRYEFISPKTKEKSLFYQPFVNFADGVYESAFG